MKKSSLLLALLLLPELAIQLSSRAQIDGVVAGSRPNFVVIVVDDLDSASMTKMPAVQRQLVASGASFERFFATTPLCCPSRSSILRGQYAHNHHVLRNTGDDAGFAAFHDSGDERETLATLLDAGGYRTALIGKYLNGYPAAGKGRTYVPPGWDTWIAGVGHSAYAEFNYQLNVNGKLVRHGHDEQDYMTDVLSGYARDFLSGSDGSGEPFFLYVSTYAPHSPATPAPRHVGAFSGATAPHTPAFNERHIRDKPAWVRETDSLSQRRQARIDVNYERRLESLLAVDEMVNSVVHLLERRGLLESTYIFLLSDNGYFMGEHRQPHGKDAPYDAAARVPLVVRGPGVPAGTSISRLALNIDLLPTISGLAGLRTPSFVDGRSLAPLFAGDDRNWRSVALLEGFGKETESLKGDESPTPPFRALRAENRLYVEYHTGERELYLLRGDPFELSNLAQRAPARLINEYSERLRALVGCAGATCARLENEPIQIWKGPQGKTAQAKQRSEHRAAHGDNRRGPPHRGKHGRNHGHVSQVDNDRRHQHHGH